MKVKNVDNSLQNDLTCKELCAVLDHQKVVTLATIQAMQTTIEALQEVKNVQDLKKAMGEYYRQLDELFRSMVNATHYYTCAIADKRNESKETKDNLVHALEQVQTFYATDRYQAALRAHGIDVNLF